MPVKAYMLAYGNDRLIFESANPDLHKTTLGAYLPGVDRNYYAQPLIGFTGSGECEYAPSFHDWWGMLKERIRKREVAINKNFNFDVDGVTVITVDLPLDPRKKPNTLCPNRLKEILDREDQILLDREGVKFWEGIIGIETTLLYVQVLTEFYTCIRRASNLLPLTEEENQSDDVGVVANLIGQAYKFLDRFEDSTLAEFSNNLRETRKLVLETWRRIDSFKREFRPPPELEPLPGDTHGL